ncbi:hypothetical protein B7463_g2442, partial [Scytalidium lignicola]
MDSTLTHTSDPEFSAPVHLPTVTISKTEHDKLLATAEKYANLCRNLRKGGMKEEVLELLIQDDQLSTEDDRTTTYSTTDQMSDGGAYLTPDTSVSQEYNPKTNSNNEYINKDLLYETSGKFEVYDGYNFPRPTFSQQFYKNEAKRTVQLSNLPEGVTHADLTNVVRGGLLLDIFLRRNDHTASISFLEEQHAQDFFRHVKRHDLYIRGKRVDIRWSDRQFTLYPHIASKIASGATRNLVLHKCQAEHTEQAIRDDLEHIHNLIVISIKFKDGNAHISTNSVHNASFARTCMMSRLTYKGFKIDWDADECDIPLPVSPHTLRKVQNAKKQDPRPSNPFSVLGTEDSNSDDTDEYDD